MLTAIHSLLYHKTVVLTLMPSYPKGYGTIIKQF